MTFPNRRQVPGLVAAVVVAALAVQTAALAGGPGDDPGLRGRFDFQRQPLTSQAVDGVRFVRELQPDYKRIEAWVSATGSAVALTDLDGAGTARDVCLTDPRTNTVTLSPAPGTPPRFQPFTLEAGPVRDRTIAPMGCLPVDLNEDGRLDLLTYYWGRTPIAHLRKESQTGLSPAAFAAVELLPGSTERWASSSVVATDVDADGHLDLVVGNYMPDGNRLLDPTVAHDEKMEMHSSMSAAANGGRNRLLRWAGASGGDAPTVRFADDSATLPQATSWTLAIGAHDFDRDQRPELYFANDFGPDYLLRNDSRPGQVAFTVLRGEQGFGTPKSKVIGNDSFKGMGVAFDDMNGDGHTDIFVSNLTAPFGLLETHFAWINTGRWSQDAPRGIAPFEDRADQLRVSRSGWSWDAKFGDFDGDGTRELVQATGFVTGETNLWPQVQELAMGNDLIQRHVGLWPNLPAGADVSGREHNAFFVRGPGTEWTNESARLGIDEPGASRGIATGDVDGDGRLDFAVANQYAESYLHTNKCTNCGRMLSLQLLLPPNASSGSTKVLPTGPGQLGSPAAGATASLRLPDGRVLRQEVDGGNGHASVSSPVLHFGLGGIPDNTDLPVELAWRDRTGTVQRATVTVRPGRHTVVLGAS
ncbi:MULTISPECIES: CRTAC1 family protein [unclassified Crossiella]|uniref:CRTAC1 family protein n=1 Tax=unclassified Crossiella TaxID=2620835 RepID=UPI001FFFE9EB|nr:MULTISPECIES: CRTAC1 family protein [unclassified Crossiella]MCK2244573.1 CRTAC1 family protein [Crossiella sp. S99.2]MCK2258204.1 CRTAC1 family protein [Crossiella sp. S99.1]